MSSMDNTVNMTIRIDKDFKKEVDSLFKKLGLNTTSAIMMFLRQCDREQGLPFIATMNVPNTRLMEALQESEDIVNNKIKAKRYKNFDEIIEDIDWWNTIL